MAQGRGGGCRHQAGDRPELSRRGKFALHFGPLGQDRIRFTEWMRTNSSLVFGTEPQLLFEENPVASLFGLDGAAAVGQAEARKSDSLPNATTGVNVYGYLRNEDGLGTVARSYVRALKALRVPTSLRDLSEFSPQRAADPTFQTFDKEHPHSVNLICVNADQHVEVKTLLGQDFVKGRHNIGVWFWELPRFPERWLDRFDDFDEIWAASSFIANTLAPISPIPIIRIPPIIAPSLAVSGERGRRRLGIRPDAFVFLFVFDFKSIFERKNPLAVVDAFRAAFGPNDKVRLIIKCVNGDEFPTELATLRSRAEGYAVEVHDGYWMVDQLWDVKAAADAYVSLHRSEGFGLTIADAMALGKPVIATAWSGNMDYMTVANSFPVRFDLVQLDRDYGPYQMGETWANPSVEHAAELMRQVFIDGEAGRSRGEIGRRDIAANFSEDRIANLVGARLDRATIHVRSSLARASRNDSGLTDHRVGDVATWNFQTGLVSRGPRLRPPDVPPMDLHGSQHGWIGRVVKRFVSYLLAYHTYYQNQVNVSLSDFIRQLAGDHDTTSRRLVNAVARINALERSIQVLRETPKLAPDRIEVDFASAKNEVLLAKTQLDSAQSQLADLTDSMKSPETRVTDLGDSVQVQKL